jgi:hypothetical protein
MKQGKSGGGRESKRNREGLIAKSHICGNSERFSTQRTRRVAEGRRDLKEQISD